VFESFLISDVNFIKWNEIDLIQNIGLSSGASAPESIIEEIRNRFFDLYEITEIQNSSIQENIYFKLPKELE
jgi:4-hydroxy-3-methylbut-2-enyl diphosphate reductase